jgi:hypothetical protein
MTAESKVVVWLWIAALLDSAAELYRAEARRSETVVSPELAEDTAREYQLAADMVRLEAMGEAAQ